MLCPRSGESVFGLSVLSFSTVVPSICGTVPDVTMFPSLLPFFIWFLYLLSCRRCSFSPQFFRRNYCICRCRFSTSMKSGKFRGLAMPPSWTRHSTGIFSRSLYIREIFPLFMIGVGNVFCKHNKKAVLCSQSYSHIPGLGYLLQSVVLFFLPYPS